jgi:hypothetical protein
MGCRNSKEVKKAVEDTVEIINDDIKPVVIKIVEELLLPVLMATVNKEMVDRKNEIAKILVD